MMIAARTLSTRLINLDCLQRQQPF